VLVFIKQEDPTATCASDSVHNNSSFPYFCLYGWFVCLLFLLRPLARAVVCDDILPRREIWGPAASHIILSHVSFSPCFLFAIKSSRLFWRVGPLQTMREREEPQNVCVFR
jgi:hypothetical protein